MKEKLHQITATALAAVTGASSREELENIRIQFLGKKGELTGILRGMGSLSAEERPIAGQLANQARESIEAALTEAITLREQAAAAQRLEAEKIDVTMPGQTLSYGKRHPTTTVLEEIYGIFTGMGFTIAEGPEVETDHYNFEALNIPKNHPSRDVQDTFFISENVVLRTHTSPVQVRVMEQQKPPIRIICPGRVYRVDPVDATHSPVFHQIEGLVIDKGITMGDLKGTLDLFAKRLYGADAKTRFRPHHFPFTEPSAEMDLACFKCHGAGCSMCKGEGYIEMLGCGMVHPRVLENCGIDPQVYSGFAFGMGLDRVVLQRFRIDDLRYLFENDLRFLKQF